MNRVSLALFGALLSFPARPSLASDAAIQQITIQSRWGGLGTPSSTEILIRNENGTYRANGVEVPGAAVQALITALHAPVLPKPSLENLGLTRPWLESNADDIIRDAKKKEEQDSTYWEVGAGNARQQALFKSSYSSPDFIAKLLPDLLNSRHTDDYPSVKVTVTYADNSAKVASTGSQSEYMLPWRIGEGGHPVETYDRAISLALVALLPTGATNRERLAGDGFALALAGAILERIEDRWNTIRAEEMAGDALAQIKSSYTLVRADVDVSHDVTFGIYSEKAAGGGVEKNLDAVVRKPSFPKGFSEEAILLYKGGKVYGADDFLQGAGRYEGLVSSVPWLAQLQTKYPDWPLTLLWVHDVSLSDKGLREFTNDMHRLHKDALADEVQKVQRNVAVLNISYGDWWLVLPDKRMILWRFESVRGLLGFKRSSFGPQECTDYQGVTGGCVGAVVSPDGQLIQ